MADDPREVHARMSPWRVAIVEVDDGRTLGAWRKNLADSGGCLTDPIGTPQQVSLDAWSAHDAEQTKLTIKFELPPDYKTASDDIQPGTLYANVEAIDPADPRWISDDEDGRMRAKGATLRAMRLALAARDGVINDPHGDAHAIALDVWDEADPDATWLVVSFSYQQRSAPWGFHGREYDLGWHWRAMDAIEPPAPPSPPP
jgi:hypothetical protein